MEPILEIARHHGIAVVEDNAHGLFRKIPKPLSRDLGMLWQHRGFHETKNITCGEGGGTFHQRSRIYRAGRNSMGKRDRPASILSRAGRQIHLGRFGFQLPPLRHPVAFLYAQLEVQAEIQENRKRIWEFYYHHLREWADRNGVQLPKVPDHCQQAYHLFYVLLPSAVARRELIHYLQQRGVNTVFHYLPSTFLPWAKTFRGEKRRLPGQPKPLANGCCAFPFSMT